MEKKKVGRPSKFTQAIADEICDRIAEGEYLTAICNKDEIPSYRTIRRWIRDNDAFAECIARASSDQMEYFRWKISILNDGMNASNWQYRNAQIRNIQWLMGKIKPRAYGDKVQAEISGKDGKAIEAAITVRFVKPNHGDGTS